MASKKIKLKNATDAKPKPSKTTAKSRIRGKKPEAPMRKDAMIREGSEALLARFRDRSQDEHSAELITAFAMDADPYKPGAEGGASVGVMMQALSQLPESRRRELLDLAGNPSVFQNPQQILPALPDPAGAPEAASAVDPENMTKEEFLAFMSGEEASPPREPVPAGYRRMLQSELDRLGITYDLSNIPDDGLPEVREAVQAQLQLMSNPGTMGGGKYANATRLESRAAIDRPTVEGDIDPAQRSDEANQANRTTVNQIVGPRIAQQLYRIEKKYGPDSAVLPTLAGKAGKYTKARQAKMESPRGHLAGTSKAAVARVEEEIDSLLDTGRLPEPKPVSRAVERPEPGTERLPVPEREEGVAGYAYLDPVLKKDGTPTAGFVQTEGASGYQAQEGPAPVASELPIDRQSERVTRLPRDYFTGQLQASLMDEVDATPTNELVAQLEAERQAARESLGPTGAGIQTEGGYAPEGMAAIVGEGGSAEMVPQDAIFSQRPARENPLDELLDNSGGPDTPTVEAVQNAITRRDDSLDEIDRRRAADAANPVRTPAAEYVDRRGQTLQAAGNYADRAADFQANQSARSDIQRLIEVLYKAARNAGGTGTVDLAGSGRAAGGDSDAFAAIQQNLGFEDSPRRESAASRIAGEVDLDQHFPEWRSQYPLYDPKTKQMSYPEFAPAAEFLGRQIASRGGVENVDEFLADIVPVLERSIAAQARVAPTNARAAKFARTKLVPSMGTKAVAGKLPLGTQFFGDAIGQQLNQRMFNPNLPMFGRGDAKYMTGAAPEGTGSALGELLDAPVSMYDDSLLDAPPPGLEDVTDTPLRNDINVGDVDPADIDPDYIDPLDQPPPGLGYSQRQPTRREMSALQALLA